MRLIKINKNVLANPESIECIEQRMEGDILVVNVYVAGRAYKLDSKQGIDKALNEFFEELGKVTEEGQQQVWVG